MKFQMSYIFAACITGLVAMIDLSAGFNPVSVGILVILTIPLILPVTSRVRMRVLFSVSLLFAAFAALYVVTVGIAFARAESLSDFEGPNGEGAPIAPVFGLGVFALLFLIPWVLVSMRGFKSLRKEKQTEQDASFDR